MFHFKTVGLLLGEVPIHQYVAELKVVFHFKTVGLLLGEVPIHQ